jgi:sodium/proline symporter
MLLLFYLAGQLLSGAVMFNKMMGVDIGQALVITGLIIMFYIVIGGAHADILTDGVQGALMLILAIGVALMFTSGFGVVGGFDGMLQELREQDPALLGTFSTTHPVLNSKWDVFAL